MFSCLRGLPRVTIPRPICQRRPICRRRAYEGQDKDFGFGSESACEHRRNGLEDTRAAPRRREWLRMTKGSPGIAAHALRRERE